VARARVRACVEEEEDRGLSRERVAYIKGSGEARRAEQECGEERGNIGADGRKLLVCVCRRVVWSRRPSLLGLEIGPAVVRWTCWTSATRTVSEEFS
jgi:hypothetical protein